MVILPITNTLNQSFKTSLNGQAIKFTAWYQEISQGWYCSMEFPVGTPIISGARLNSSSPLLQSTLSDFEGDIVPVPTIAPYFELTKEPWNTSHILVYLTPEEVEGG